MTDVTADERREVAENLRKVKAECEERGYPWMVEDLLEALGFETYEDGEDGIFDRLADLIDPTCKNKLDELNRMAPVEMRTDNFVCSACGETFCADPDGVNFPIDWAYCPNCGARVVRDDD